MDTLLCAHIEFLVDDRISNRFGLLSTKLPMSQLNDEWLISDLKERMHRRQRSPRPLGEDGMWMPRANPFSETQTSTIRGRRAASALFNSFNVARSFVLDGG